MDYEAMSYIMASKPRFRILTELRKGNKVPSELSKLIKLPISHVSGTLRELQDNGFVKCLTPGRRKKKFFKITEKGEQVLDDINKETRK